jgi:NADH-quinone oxidoreductase subunit E
MLTDEEKKEIEAEFSRCEHHGEVTVEALLVVQKRRGWISDENLREIAGLLAMTPAEVDAVATFYSFIFRKPVGRHIIALCDSMVCWSLGHSPLYKQLSEKLGIAFGGTTPDGRFTLLPAACLGACDRAPAVLVDEDLHGPVTPEMMDEILSKYK